MTQNVIAPVSPREGVSTTGLGSLTGVAHLPGTALGIYALGGAAILAACLYGVNARLGDRPEFAVGVSGIILSGAALLPAALYLFRYRSLAAAGRTGRLLLAGVLASLVGIYLYRALVQVLFPADILIWSESDFVNDILKLRVGYPLYTAQQNNESFTYVPGAQILTFALAWLVGKTGSLPVYRLVQVLFTVSAAGMAAFCCRRILAMTQWGRDVDVRGWTPVWMLLFVLFASNSVTNPFVQNLHGDALALLVNATAYAVLLVYTQDRARKWLVVMTVLPALGFLAKQNLLIWGPLYLVFLAAFDRQRSAARVVAVGAGMACSLGIVLASAYLLWGQPFFYWTFTVLGSHGVSTLRAVQHVFDTWIYYAAGLLGGAVLLRGERNRPLVGCWLIWLTVMLVEIYTSAIAWMLNHIGPASLMAGIWLAAALPVMLPVARDGVRPVAASAWADWQRALAGVVLLVLSCSGFGFIRVPIAPIPRDAYRYVEDVEREFRDASASDVLLDFGSWNYLKDGVVMKDRAPSIGERGYSQTGDFSGIRQRIESKRYAKILVRRLHSPDFWYDHYLWDRPSGIRELLLENYEQTRTIKHVDGWIGGQVVPYGFDDISVLVPRAGKPGTLGVKTISE